MAIKKTEFAEWKDDQTNLRIAASSGGNVVEIQGVDGKYNAEQAAGAALALTEAAKLAKPATG